MHLTNRRYVFTICTDHWTAVRVAARLYCGVFAESAHILLFHVRTQPLQHTTFIRRYNDWSTTINSVVRLVRFEIWVVGTLLRRKTLVARGFAGLSRCSYFLPHSRCLAIPVDNEHFYRLQFSRELPLFIGDWTAARLYATDFSISQSFSTCQLALIIRNGLNIINKYITIFKV